MKKIALTIAVFGMLVVAAQQVRAEEGWTSLFDGKSFAGWKASENKDSWKIVDGRSA